MARFPSVPASADPALRCSGEPSPRSGCGDARGAPATPPLSRRAALRWAMAAGGLPLLGGAATSGAAASLNAVPTFSRGINAWPWFAIPLADPPAGEPYSAWPPYDAARPVPTRADLLALAAAGFDFIRLVVDPAPFLNTEGLAAPGQFEALWDLLRSAIGEARAAGLGVIVNLQPGGSRRWSPDALYGPGAMPGDVARLTVVVAALARRLATLTMPRLALEPVNEPSQDAASPAGAADWNRKQIRFLAAARSAAPTLTLVATGASGGSAAALAGLDPKPLIDRFEPLLFTFHFYEPYLFSHQGAPWAAVGSQLQYRWLNAVPWPAAEGSLKAVLAAVEARMAADPLTSAAQKTAALRLTTRLMTDYFVGNVDRHYFASFFDAVSAWASHHDIAPARIVLGEFGSLKSTTTDLDTWDAAPQSVTGGPYVAAHAADRIRYLGDVRLTSEEHGFGWAMWTLFNPGMGLITQDATHRPDPAVLAALGLATP